MMAMAAARLGYRTVVLDPGDPCPAAQVCNTHLVGAYDDPAELDRLAALCDVVTYEFENVPSHAAERLSASTVLHPNQRSLAVSQDRLVEKEFLRSVGIETAPFRAVSTVEEVRAAVEAFGGEVIVKTRRFGYDGKGQVRFRGSVPHDLVESMGSTALIAEGVIDFDAEISVIAARSIRGDVRCFEPARNTHDDGILVASEVPAGVSPDVVDQAVGHARRLITALDYVGVLGLELFVMGDGTVLANEFAPRVHNSGHWTELVCDVDQFEQHIRAIAGHPLGVPTATPCEMINLIGDDVDRVPQLLADGDWRVHLYGKAEVRPGRKMGHATRRVGKR
jgi:5-(carboxyamino)imidazole ribonucleotide synthase